jgi:D-alanine-D-alanine ligase
VNLLQKNVLFLYNQVSKKYKYGLFRECTLDKDVKAIREALIKTKDNILSLDLYNHEQLDNFIAENKPINFAFVLAEGYKDYPQTLYNGFGASRVREQLKKHGIPSSHASIESMEICRNKDFTYKKLQENNIPIPNFFVFDSHNRFRKKDFLKEINRIGYPLMIKPAGGGDSIGITSKSVVHNLIELKNKIETLKRTLGPEKLILEQYLPGQEYTVGILGSDTKYILPIIAFPIDWGIRYTRTKNKEYRMQSKFKIIDHKHPLFSSIVDISVNSFIAVKASDVIRLDIKKDTDGNLYVIDINGTPALSLNGSLTFMASKVGLSHSQLIKIIFYESMVRNNLAPSRYLEEVIEPLKKRLYPHKGDNLIEVFSEDE